MMMNNGMCMNPNMNPNMMNMMNMNMMPIMNNNMGMNQMNSTLTRLKKEYELCSADNELSLIGCSFALIDNNYYKWKVTIIAPKGTPYENGLFFIQIIFPEDYPKSGAEFRFLNHIYHLNVDLRKESFGHICLTSLNEWRTTGKVDGKTQIIPTSISGTSISNMQSYFTIIPEKLDKESDGVTEKNYDLLKGKLPENKNELLLIIDSRNRLDKTLVKYLGLDDTKEEITFDEILNCEFKLILNNEFYRNLGTFYTINLDLDSMYENKNAVTLKVVGIIRGKKDNKLTRSDAGIGYTEDLVDYVIEQNKESSIVKQQQSANYNVLTGEKIDEETKETILSYLGATTVPVVINIYPKDFNSKDKIVKYLDEYNSKEIDKVKDIAINYLNIIKDKVKDNEKLLKNVDKSLLEITPDTIDLYLKNDKLNGTIKVGNSEFIITDGEITKSTGGVLYNDLAATMVSLSGSLMDAVTVVLIAFSAISLVVSSIMIGIITYISVLERTKEIGILRALGARKKDISRVFNAETFIIGVTSGLLGILIARLLIIPANAILYNLTELEDVARLNPIHALILIIVSVTLTVIGGLIPAKVASKKDPVEALRTE